MSRNPFIVAEEQKTGNTDDTLTHRQADMPRYLQNIPVANWQPKKRNDNRKREPVFFIRNIYDLKEPLQSIAGTIGVPRDMLVRYLLEHGVKRHHSGEQILEPVFIKRLTLFPDEPAPRKTRKKARAKGVGFRGLPGELVMNVRKIADELSVPVWQVVRRLLEQGIEDYRSGNLEMPVVPVQSREYTLYPEES